jgi:hypothetical protein
MATPEIKQFSTALTALSNSALDVMKDMDQRIAASKKMADNLNAITAHNKQIIERQITLVQALVKQNVAAEKELKALRDELRWCTVGRPNSTTRQESRKGANDFNLPPLGDLLDKLRNDYESVPQPRKASVSCRILRSDNTSAD